MIIREVHIDRFGALHNSQIKGLGKGLNVLYGSNEFGKTTLLEFIRRLLFGFPRRKSSGLNSYLPNNGDSVGGEIFCDFSNGDAIRIRRYSGGTGDRITLTENSGKILSPDLLNKFLGHASSDLFHNIFAFTLDELQLLGSLQGDEIRNRIYGAGLGMGPTLLTETEKYFKVRCDNLFRPRGKSQKITAMLEEINRLRDFISDLQNQIEQYDFLHVRSRALEKERKNLGESIAELEDKRRNLEILADLYPIYLEWLRSLEELDSIGDLGQLPDNPNESRDKISSEIINQEKRLEEEIEYKSRLQSQVECIFIDTHVLDCRDDILTLVNMTEQIRSILNERTILGDQRDRLEYEIQSDLERLGRQWTEKSIETFHISDREKERILEHRENLNENRQRLNLAQERLEDHRQEKAMEISKLFQPPEWLHAVAYSLGGLGFSGMAIGMFLGNMAVGIFSFLVTSLGGICLGMIHKSKAAFLPDDHVVTDLESKVQSLETEKDALFKVWQVWLQTNHLDEYLSPLQAEKLILTIRDVKDRITRRTDIDLRLALMEETVEKASFLSQRIQPENKLAADRKQLPTLINFLGRALEKATRNQEKQSALKIQWSSQCKKVSRLQQQLNELLDSRDALIKSAGAESLEDFQALCEQKKKKTGLEFRKLEKRNIIQSRVGVGDEFDEFIKTLSRTTLDEIQHEIEKVDDQLSSARSQKDTLLEESGEIKNRLDQLALDESLSQKSLAFETLKTQLNQLAREWALNRISLHMIGQTKRKYERERQPKVLRSAEQYFSTITNNRYQKICFSLDSDEIRIEDGTVESKSPTQMSRGTREQLYLSIRLGLIDQYEQQCEPLPIIMDDALVNFDDARGERVICILKNFAKNRQVIVFTCHRPALETYQALGAHTIITVMDRTR